MNKEIGQEEGKMRSYVVDDTGRKKAIIIDLEEFTKLIEYMEDIMESLDLKKAVEQDKEFIELHHFMQQMSREGKL